jgi:hypothetical protein
MTALTIRSCAFVLLTTMVGCASRPPQQPTSLDNAPSSNSPPPPNPLLYTISMPGSLTLTEGERQLFPIEVTPPIQQGLSMAITYQSGAGITTGFFQESDLTVPPNIRSGSFIMEGDGQTTIFHMPFEAAVDNHTASHEVTESTGIIFHREADAPVTFFPTNDSFKIIDLAIINNSR